MKNLLPRVAWDYLVGAVVGITAAAVVLFLVGLVSLVLGRPSQAGELLRAGWLVTGLVSLLGVLLVVTIYELAIWQSGRGKMLEPGTIDARVLSRDVIMRAILSGAEAGVYITVVTVVFALLSRGAGTLSPFWALLIGLLLAIVVIAAGALAYAYVGPEALGYLASLKGQERTALLLLPLVLGVTSGFFFGAAAGGASGVVSAIVAAVLTFFLVRNLETLDWRMVRRSGVGLLHARGVPTIKVVSTHKT